VTVPDRIAQAMRNGPRLFVGIADHVLPESALPKTGLALFHHASRPRTAQPRRMGEPGLDLLPATREVGIPRRQGPDGVDMVRQDHHGPAIDRMLGSRHAVGLAQKVDVVDQRAVAFLGQVDREEISSSRDAQSAVVRHGIDLDGFSRA
jgi:hypothetical protein